MSVVIGVASFGCAAVDGDLDGFAVAGDCVAGGKSDIICPALGEIRGEGEYAPEPLPESKKEELGGRLRAERTGICVHPLTTDTLKVRDSFSLIFLEDND